ncbi:MAG: FAD-dependent oxidoreductase [Treponema sp.]|nr:FAD-dependent oxidoreductase [Treponema sp.]
MNPGTYHATVPGFNGPLSVEVTVSADTINNIRVTDHVETPGLSDWAIQQIPERIIREQSLAVDVVSGVTVTSFVIIDAVEDALKQAGADTAVFSRPARSTRPAGAQNLDADVIIVGGGGAGLAAAVSATESGASVILIEKTGFLGGNSIVAGGIYNVPNSPQQQALTALPGDDRLIQDALALPPTTAKHRELQEKVRAEFEQHRRNSDKVFDSPAWFALQSWLGGDMQADLPLLYHLTSNALAGFNWMKSMNMQFQNNAMMGTGSMYRRTIRSELPNGTGFIKAFRETLDTRDNYTQLMETTATGLIIENGRVVGVNAADRHGNTVTLRANRGVILATGGFAGNVELRQHYAEGEFWPYLGPTLNTTNVSGVTGDGILFARDVGAELIGMEHLQLLHVANPRNGLTNDHVAAVSGTSGTMFVNREGRRFVREDGRRDEISQAVLAQTGRMYFMVKSADVITNPDRDRTLDGRNITFMLENNLSGFVRADTLKELAALIDVDYSSLAATISEFNYHSRTNTPDRFGRVVFGLTFENGPWYAYPRSSATHYTMGGVRVDEYSRALRPDGTPIPGLYAAGEIIGGLHGTNRLGGNAIVEFVVFGRIAGESAAAAR